MRPKVARASALILAGAIGSLSIVSDAKATTIITQANSCTNYNAGEAQDLDRLISGVRNLNSSSSRQVTCSVPRVMPKPDGQTDWFFNVSGSNSGGGQTCCTLYATRSYDGAFLDADSFCATAATYDTLLSLSGSLVDTWDYTSLVCTLPSSGRGLLRGFTSHEPD